MITGAAAIVAVIMIGTALTARPRHQTEGTTTVAATTTPAPTSSPGLLPVWLTPS